jgi:predicted ATP-dependent serine protease
VTIIGGAPGSGKTYLSIASSVQAIHAGWDVLYLASEMGEKGIFTRARAYCYGPPPEAWKLILVDFGAEIDNLIELIAEHLTERKTLIVMDSISSFVDQAKAKPSENDPHAIGLLKRVVMWALNVKRRSEGHVSFLVLSELNAEGKTKGRFGDHKADLVVRLETDEEQTLLKEVRVVKGWDYQLGVAGLFRLSPSTARLVRVE